MPSRPTGGGGEHDAVKTVRTDLRHFVQALSEAVRTATAPGAQGAGASTGRTGFTSGLSTLVSKVASGDAPQAL